MLSTTEEQVAVVERMNGSIDVLNEVSEKLLTDIGKFEFN